MQTTVKILALVGKILGVLSGLAAQADVLPDKWAPIGVIVFGISSILKDTVNRIGDFLDDGKVNDSFTPTK